MTDDKRILAHSLPGRPQAEWEDLRDHADAVGRLAACFASRFGWAAMASAAALLHDAGKASFEFQAYIRGDRPRGGDHAAAAGLARSTPSSGRYTRNCWPAATMPVLSPCGASWKGGRQTSSRAGADRLQKPPPVARRLARQLAE